MAFFSRLEERKGIKVFVEALHQLNHASLSQSQVRLQEQMLTFVADLCPPAFNGMLALALAPSFCHDVRVTASLL